ncbi:TnsD family Tn7-like transposition protein [Paenibacillus glycinis]|uniref:Transposon Tn7 transposition protein TnsD C-termianl domain-containing protein n=1 Tax=Paenibacillus glycinis TaxID=2697035 RepID=A0ABW9XSJ0_9BACL|nr:TnsD family Tn7-like transposition protein [Paenibacillus glycinis]NBD25635.1 hypothetical protein [Paenibacillus glycinis]
MMNFLPTLYEDELLYSVISRYKQMCGIVSKIALAKDLFSEKTFFTSILFPQHLNKLIKNFPPNADIGLEELIQKHTMFNFYTAYLSKELTRKIFDGMANGRGSGIENLAGLAGSRVKLNEYLKYCPECVKEQLETFGQPYWKRSHQIVGALYCLKHEIPLQDTIVLSSDHSLGYFCLDEDVLSPVAPEIKFSDEIKKFNLQYIRESSYLLETRVSRKDQSFIMDFYIDRLREKGFASKSGSIYRVELLKEFIGFFPKHYLEQMQSSIDLSNETNWLYHFVRKNSKNKSPLRHLLLMQFLGIKAGDVFKRRKAKGKLINQNSCTRMEDLRNSQPDDRGGESKKTNSRRARNDFIDWSQRDEDCLQLARQAVVILLSAEDKPKRITPSSIRRAVGVRRWFSHKNLIKTCRFIEENTEDIYSFRIRKIKWAVKELLNKQCGATIYQVQLYAGFGGSNKEIKSLIEKVMQRD